MKKILIGGIVGGIIIFLWQFLSWTVLDLHRPANEHTPKQDAIIKYLNEQFAESGSYRIPNTPRGASSDEMENFMKEAVGKPWAVVAYHKSLDGDMTMNMIRGLLVDILMVILLGLIVSGFANLRSSNVLLTSLFVGFISFLHFPYTIHIWFDTFDLSANLIDAIVAWGLAGLWLGWYLPRKKATVNVTVR